MNKKFFAALASATMALSATGSLAVFADDFDVVDETTNTVTGGVTTNPDGSVTFDETNFSKTFIDDIINENNSNTIDGKNFKVGRTYTKEQLAKVTTITISEAKDVRGIEAFPNLTTFTSTSEDLDSADLSKNTKLETVSVKNAITLDELLLPATNTLKHLTVTGKGDAKRCPLPILDLSGNKNLRTVTVNATDIAKIDLSNNVFLLTANLSHNKLNTVNVSGAAVLGTLAVNNNHLYELTLPDYGSLTTLYAQNNKIQALDVTKEPGLVYMNIANNCLRTLDLSENKALSNLNAVNNNLGYLDLSETKAYTKWQANPSNDSLPGDNKALVTPQHTYVDSIYDTVNLPENFEGFNKKNVVGKTDQNDRPTNGKYSKEDGTFTFDKDVNGGSYNYDTGHGRMTVYLLKADLMNRLYNPNSGEHFYTKDVNEKDVLVGLGWHDEGIGWVAPMEKLGQEPVYRLYNPNAGDHHYTTDSRERDALVSAGWKSEGIGWYSAAPTTVFNWDITHNNTVTVDRLALYREYNPNAKAAGAHNYTLNEAENDFLCSVGWIPEGIAWYGLK